MDFPVLYLRKGAERRLKAGHLWVYSNEVDTRRSPLTDFEAGSQAQLRASNDKPLGTVFVNPHALICGRLISRNATTGMTPKRLTDRLETALKLRDRVFPEPWYRWVYGDSDGLSGLVIDRFGDVVVVQISTAGMEAMKEAIVRGVQRLVHPEAIILKNDGKMRSVEGLPSYVEQVEGEPVDVLQVRENGVLFEVPLSGGQKTGWFYDHRINNVDTLEGDAFEVLKGLADDKQKFDIVVLDPPALIPRRRDQKAGEQAYARLNQLGLRPQGRPFRPTSGAGLSGPGPPHGAGYSRNGLPESLLCPFPDRVSLIP